LLTKADLFARLGQGHAARLTVVTPNKRLSQALMAEFDVFQVNRDLSVWEAPDILPFDAFVERLWEDALYSDLGETLPLLLTPAQEQHIWLEIVQGSDFLLKEGAAQQCREAWRLVHQWRIGNGPGNEDAAAFSIGLIGPVGAMAVNGVGAAGILGSGATWAFVFALVGVLLVRPH
jgi:ATP-dependent helicase/nuclease subunit B